MNEIILQIKKEMLKQGVTTPKMLERIGEANENEIRKTNRCLSGKTQRLDSEWIAKVYKALGITEELPEGHKEEGCSILKIKELHPAKQLLVDEILKMSEEEALDLVADLRLRHREGGRQPA